jgi:uncharacterized membrane protein YhaH (DUF805 family)
MTRWIFAVHCVAGSFLLFSQAYGQHATDEDAVACAACGGLAFVILAVFVINVAILVWVARDAKARGMTSPAGWLILIFFIGILGLIIYVLSRPSGRLERCPHCGNKRLQAMAKCPHCGN